MAFAPRLRRLRRRLLRTLPPIALASVAAVALAACGGDGGNGGGGEKAEKQPDLVIYSGREKELAEPLYNGFEKETGLTVEVRYAESPELAATLQEEGDRSPADVFYAQDAGALGSVDNLLATLPQETLDKVDERWRDDGGRWVGVTGRVRVLVYNTEMVDEGDLPDSVFDLTDTEWKGKVGVAPTNASFEGFVTGMRLAVGDERTLEWLEDMAANDAQIYQKNGQITDAVGKGEVPVGLVNHYYLYERLEKNPDLPIANHFFKAGDPGTLVNVSAVGILESGDNTENAQKFVEYLLSEGQRYIANDAPEREYPLVDGVAGTERAEELPPLEQVKGPQVDLSRLGDELAETVELIQKSGLAT